MARRKMGVGDLAILKGTNATVKVLEVKGDSYLYQIVEGTTMFCGGTGQPGDTFGCDRKHLKFA